MTVSPRIKKNLWATGCFALALFTGPLAAQEFSRPVPSLPRSPQTGEVVVTTPENAETEAAAGNEMPKKEAAPPAPKWFWELNPPYRIIPRSGDFPIPPSGPGYYSLLDVVRGDFRENPPKSPYGFFALMPPSFFDADFRYLDNPKNTQHDLFDPLHRIHLGEDFLFGTGGQLWYRHMHEVNSRLSGKDNDYDLFRTRVFGDLWYQDCIRVYGEFITAQSFNQDLAPLAIDRNYSDVLNAFVDVKIADWNDKPAYVRVGRQELLLGSQRLISALDWANTRRTFDGIRVFRQGEKFDFDLFWTSPVVVSVEQLDSHDNNRNFAGAWFTYRPEKGQFLDLYYLFLDDASKSALKVGKQPAVAKAPYNVHTLGARSAGDHNHWLWDVEGDLQLGERGAQDIVAGAVAVGGGRNFHQLPLNPTLWVYFDYASGDRDPTGGNYNTFNQLFPFGHYYLGWLDLVGRQNIQDLNAQLYLYPANWITMKLQYHNFRLDSAKDFLYSAGAAALRRDPTGKSSRDVGDEFDVFVNFHLGQHSDFLVGWSHLNAGEFLQKTASSPAAARSPELFYIMYNFRW